METHNMFSYYIYHKIILNWSYDVLNFDMGCLNYMNFFGSTFKNWGCLELLQVYMNNILYWWYRFNYQFLFFRSPFNSLWKSLCWRFGLCLLFFFSSLKIWYILVIYHFMHAILVKDKFNPISIIIFSFKFSLSLIIYVIYQINT